MSSPFHLPVFLLIFCGAEFVLFMMMNLEFARILDFDLNTTSKEFNFCFQGYVIALQLAPDIGGMIRFDAVDLGASYVVRSAERTVAIALVSAGLDEPCCRDGGRTGI